MKKIIASPHAPKAVGPYSQAVEAGGALYVSGQLPIDGATQKMAEGIEAQTRQSLTNLRHILEEAGYTLGDVAKTTVLLQDIGDFAAMNAVYAGFFTSGMPRAYATRSPHSRWGAGRDRRRRGEIAVAGHPVRSKCAPHKCGAHVLPFVNNLWISLVPCIGLFHRKE